MRGSLVLHLAFFVSALGLVRCSSSPTPCYQDAVCLSSLDASADGSPVGSDGGDGGPTVGPPSGCNPEADAKDAPACAVDEYAIFVDSSAGSDTAAGTRAAPVKTIATALSKLAGRPRIYLCEGTYAEQVKVAAAVSIFGGFACGTWTYTGTKSKLAPAAKGYALQVSGANGATYSDLEITALDATDPGESSIAVFVASSTLTFTRLNIVAGVGQAGATAQQKAQAPATGLKGGSATNPTGGAGTKNACPDGDSIGGTGANTNAIGASAGKPDLGLGKGGLSGAPDCASGGLGGAGHDGTKGGAAAALTTLGELTAAGWTPANGARGKAGTLAQGGGGGGSSTEAAGGGGGAGGCGGEGGEGGGGGGASVALLAFESSLVITGCSLTARDGGAGGGGAAGQKGQGFGSGGDQGAGPTQSGCAGGRGGSGGDGGGGGGGSGGVSAAILFTGPALQVDVTCILTSAKAGAAGPGAEGNAGLDGKSDKIVQTK